MYIISKQNHNEAIKILENMETLVIASDNKTLNLKRQAKLLVRKLRKSKQITLTNKSCEN